YRLPNSPQFLAGAGLGGLRGGERLPSDWAGNFAGLASKLRPHQQIARLSSSLPGGENAALRGRSEVPEAGGQGRRDRPQISAGRVAHLRPEDEVEEARRAVVDDGLE